MIFRRSSSPEDSPPPFPGADGPRPRLWGSRPYWLLLADVLIAWVALWGAIHLRFLDGDAGDVATRLSYFEDWSFWAWGLALAASRVASNLYFSTHRWSFKFSSLRDGARLVLAAFSGTVLFVLVSFFVLRPFTEALPRSVVAIELMLAFAAMAAFRFTPRVLWMYRADLSGRRRGERTLIVGAGNDGEMLLRKLQRQQDPGYHAVGFVDDDPAKWGHIVGGIPVLGSVDQLPQLAKTLRVRQVVIAVPRLDAGRLREILSMAFSEPVRFKMLPEAFGSLDDRDLTETLRDISTEDLLSRAELIFRFDDASSPGPHVQPERSLMVVGAAGSIGREVTLQLLRLGARRLIMVDTDENGLYVLRRRFETQFPDCELHAEVADIRELSRLGVLFRRHRPADVFHAAARKHVPLMEAAPGEAVKTNVLGTLNLARAAREVGAERFVFMSTDKAVRPTSVMGATKRLGELVLHSLGEGPTRYSVVRFGNVLDSAGSVVPLFREQIARGGPVTVTHPEAKRYFMTISEAVGLVLRAAYGDYGRLCVLEMGDPIKIVDLARQMITMAGLVPDVDVPIRFMGLRPGEKLYEELLTDGERVVRSVDKKIRVVEGPPAPPELENLVQELRVAALSEDDEATLTILRRLLPDYDAFHGGGSRIGGPDRSSDIPVM